MKKSYFTLTELLITIAIVSMLAAMVTMASKHAINKAQIAKCRVQMNSLEVALEQFYQTYHKWPFDSSTGLHSDSKTVSSKSVEMNTYLADGNITGSGWDAGTYFERVVKILQAEDRGNVNARKKAYLPVQGNETGVYNDPWGNEFRIYVSTKHNGKIVIDADTASGAECCVPGLSIDANDSNQIIIYKNVFVVSKGPDGKWKTDKDDKDDEDNEDNVYSMSTRWVDNLGHEIAE